MGVNADREIADNSYHPSHLISVDNTTGVATIKLVPFHTHSSYVVSIEVLTFSLNDPFTITACSLRHHTTIALAQCYYGDRQPDMTYHNISERVGQAVTGH
jgi:hypothetical protein